MLVYNEGRLAENTPIILTIVKLSSDSSTFCANRIPRLNLSAWPGLS